jgi:hypothetical protein
MLSSHNYTLFCIFKHIYIIFCMFKKFLQQGRSQGLVTGEASLPKKAPWGSLSYRRLSTPQIFYYLFTWFLGAIVKFCSLAYHIFQGKLTFSTFSNKFFPHFPKTGPYPAFWMGVRFSDLWPSSGCLLVQGHT